VPFAVSILTKELGVDRLVAEMVFTQVGSPTQGYFSAQSRTLADVDKSKLGKLRPKKYQPVD
jgi:hypothetical protein